MSASIQDERLLRGERIVETATFRETGSHVHRRISWAAVFGGVVMMIAAQLLFSMLGAGIGLGTVDVNGGGTPHASTLGMAAGIWWLVSSCIALGFGGYVAGWLAGVEIRFDGVLHGLVSWGLATLLALYLLTSALGSIIGGGFSALGHVASAAGSGIKDVAQPLAQSAGVTPDRLEQDARSYLQPTNPDPATMSQQDAQKEIARNLAIYAKGGPDAADARQRVIAIMAAQSHISQDEAAKRFDDTEAKIKQERDRAIQAAKNAADASAAAASKTSFAAFTVLVLGAVAAALGGAFAVQRRVALVERTTVTAPRI